MNITAKNLLIYTATLFLLILSISALVVVPKLGSSKEQAMITVSGSADLQAVPDIASFTFNVSEVSDTPEEAQKVISEKISVILDGLDELGIEKKDVRTDSYSISPRYEWVEVQRTAQKAVDGTIYFPGRNQQVLIGYDVRQSVTVTLRDLDLAPQTLTLLASQQVENLYGPNFEIENPEKLQEEAREQAIEEAQKKAKRLARDLGVKLGDIASFNENNGGYYPQPYYAKAVMNEIAEDEAYMPELPQGEQDISSQVSISYYIR